MSSRCIPCANRVSKPCRPHCQETDGRRQSRAVRKQICRWGVRKPTLASRRGPAAPLYRVMVGIGCWKGPSPSHSSRSARPALRPDPCRSRCAIRPWRLPKKETLLWLVAPRALAQLPASSCCRFRERREWPGAARGRARRARAPACCYRGDGRTCSVFQTRRRRLEPMRHRRSGTEEQPASEGG